MVKSELKRITDPTYSQAAETVQLLAYEISRTMRRRGGSTYNEWKNLAALNLAAKACRDMAILRGEL